MSNIGDPIRVLLTIALIAVVYTETGWSTALCMALLAARAEILDYNSGRTWK